MTDADQWIGKVYNAKIPEELRIHYNEWAETYDADLLTTGYLHYAVMAGLVARHISAQSAHILDVGVGTGALGEVLRTLGYTSLHGLDMSTGMLAKAEARGIYRSLIEGTLGTPLTIQSASIDAVVSTGTFTTGHATPSAFAEIARILKPQGKFIITVGTQVWADLDFEVALQRFFRRVETTPTYHPMPHSAAEKGFTARAHVWQKE